ncbi:DNA-binding response regulator [Niveispirillum sp. SYP-B3756]|uniref:LytTR family DNA-binding domain-containing protein n=1 Tax=Niveispirillum sp. SYP-B3756 TaxID=2662178 RepID=UPI001290FBBC|nr:LytTR family DNA-binding domain-containing protein [Niveispirillum sp. SYP-B3756]MQP64463.1 DNA-binding response regulator [Niveispirillum sp. SYP-B3756]
MVADGPDWRGNAPAGKADGMAGTAAVMAGTGGTRWGTGGNPFRPRPYLLLALLVLLSNSFNVMTAVQEGEWAGKPLSWWFIAMLEGSSGIMILATSILPALALARAPLSAPWGRQALAHLPALLLFSTLHVVGMAGLRELCSWLFDLNYHFRLSPDVMLYEFRKDAITYIVLAAIFVATGLGRVRPENDTGMPSPVTTNMPTPIAPAQFDIRDGARLWRVSVADILAVRSAGNYAEFLLADGRALLMRATLTQLLADLSPHGLVRPHRSWLVNPAHVRALLPDGSGDYSLTLSDSRTIPASRRYPTALATLRGG